MKKELKYVTAAILLFAVFLLLIFVLLSKPSSGSNDENTSEQIVINLVYAYKNNQWNSCIEEIVRRFEEDYPHIDIQYKIRYEDTVYEDLLYKLAARDELGDIVQIKEPYAWVESGLIAPLPDSLANLVNTTCTVNGNTYGVCALGTTTGIVYNKKIFNELNLSLPQNYNEFLSLCQTLKENDITPLGIGGKDLWHFEYWLNHFLRSDILSVEPDFLAKCSSGQFDWSDPLITQLFTHFNQLFQLGYVDESWPSTPDGALAYHMAEEQVAMVFSDACLATDILNINPSLDLGWFYVPNTSGRVVAGESLDVFWTVTQNCAQDAERYEAAVMFLNYFFSEDIYEEIYTAMAGFSTLNDASRDQGAQSGILSETNAAHMDAELRISGYVGDENTPPNFEKKLLTLLSRMCAGELTVAETQALASQYWDECLRQEVSYEN